MIEKIWSVGTASMDETNPTMGFRIEMLWHEGEAEVRKDFSGENVDKVLQDAMEFILTHYRENVNNKTIL